MEIDIQKIMIDREILEDVIIKTIKDSKFGFLLTPQIEKNTIELLPNTKFDEPGIEFKIRDALLDLMEKGLLDALILDNNHKKWILEHKFKGNIEDLTKKSIKIPDGFYYGWKFCKCISESKLNTIFEEYGLKKNIKGFFLDTYYLREFGKEFIKQIRYYLSNLQKNNQMVETKLLWVLPNKRDDFLIFPIESCQENKNLDFNSDLNDIKEIKTNHYFPIKVQKQVMAILDKFRKLGMCEYGPIMEYIQYHIHMLSNPLNNELKSAKIRLDQLTDLYLNFLRMLVSKHFIPEKPNVHRWDSFFKIFQIPIEIDKIDIFKLDMKNEIFFASVNISYVIKLDPFKDNFLELIDYLKDLGYTIKTFNKSVIVIGDDFNLDIYYSIEEQLNFQNKYLINFCLFNLWRHVCEFFISKAELGEKFLSILKKDIEFSKFLQKWVDNNFNYIGNNVPKLFSLKLIDEKMQKDEIDIIYNKFLFSELYDIEVSARKFISKRQILVNILGKESLISF